jgi:multimeric flavodoxin WrbA
MKVLLINGSPKADGCTRHCLNYISDIFNQKGIEYKIIDIPKQIVHCDNCRECKRKSLPCVKDKLIEETIKEIETCDGIIIGSPTYYYSITSQLQAFITRLCYSQPTALKNKLCSFFSVSRRSGNTNCFDQMMKIFQMHGAIMVGGNYVNEIYGDNPNELQYDKEGMLSLKTIAENFAILMPLLDKLKLYDEKKIHTNFISREFLNFVDEDKKREELAKLYIESYS